MPIHQIESRLCVGVGHQVYSILYKDKYGGLANYLLFHFFYNVASEYHGSCPYYPYTIYPILYTKYSLPATRTPMLPETTTPLLALHYFPCLEYFSCFTRPGEVLLEAHEHFIKQSYRNRCYILGPHQVEKLTVPVVGGTKKILVRDLKVDSSQPWQRQHWRSLQSCYGKSPFFEHYAPRLAPVFQEEWKYLWDLNEKVLTLCLDLLQLPATPAATHAYIQQTGTGLYDLRQAIRPNLPFTARDLYCSVPYTQLFGAKFVANLSVLDVLFCEGPAAASVIRQSAKQK